MLETRPPLPRAVRTAGRVLLVLLFLVPAAVLSSGLTASLDRDGAGEDRIAAGIAFLLTAVLLVAVSTWLGVFGLVLVGPQGVARRTQLRWQVVRWDERPKVRRVTSRGGTYLLVRSGRRHLRLLEGSGPSALHDDVRALLGEGMAAAEQTGGLHLPPDVVSEYAVRPLAPAELSSLRRRLRVGLLLSVALVVLVVAGLVVVVVS